MFLEQGGRVCSDVLMTSADEVSLVLESKSWRRMGGNVGRGMVSMLLSLMLMMVLFMYGFQVYANERATIETLKQQLEKERMHYSDPKGKADLEKANEIETSEFSFGGVDPTKLNGTKFHDNMSGQNERLVRELVYRRNTRYWLENKHMWPKNPIPIRDKFVTFTPWPGGFNNIRMSLEMAIAFAFATNRTLVMPPDFKMYLRGKGDLLSYFDYEDMRRGLSVIKFQEFYDLVELGKHQREKFDPNRLHSSVDRFYEGLNKMDGVYNTSDHWKPNTIGGQVAFCVPNCKYSSGLRGVAPEDTKKEQKYFDRFTARLKTFDTDDPSIRDARVVHFPKNLLGHFYTMVLVRDPLLRAEMRRVIRDHVHYKENIVELAERVIQKLGDFQFSCLHIRRNDFQFKEAWISADKIVENTKAAFKPGEMIYVSTDELSSEKEKKRSWSDPTAMISVQKHTFFEPFVKEWGREKVAFLSDFFDELLKGDTPGHLIGCVENMICTRARVFIGTTKSTFSGYVHRIRGYMNDVRQNMILDAQTVYPYGYYEYFKGPQWYTLGHAYGGGHPYWGREYKDAWEGVGDAIW
mmetsp:Transcript_34161/g.54712  ORF Transcript_34161/g.54712 Transcript_34161/m.54712 type:complete len:578 (+) Transcript_34161:305-2038(+)